MVVLRDLTSLSLSCSIRLLTADWEKLLHHYPRKTLQVAFGSPEEEEYMASYAVEILEWDNSVRDVCGDF